MAFPFPGLWLRDPKHDGIRLETGSRDARCRVQGLGASGLRFQGAESTKLPCYGKVCAKVPPLPTSKNRTNPPPPTKGLEKTLLPMVEIEFCLQKVGAEQGMGTGTVSMPVVAAASAARQEATLDWILVWV